MLSRRHLLAAAPLLLLPASQARAAVRLRAVLLQLEPLAYPDAQGRPTGIFVDLLNELAGKSGVAIDIQVAPYARAAAMLAASNADLIVAIPGNKNLMENESMGVLATPEVLAVGRAGLALERLQDLRGRTVAYLRTAHYGGALDEEPSIVRHETSSHEQSLKMLLERRVDAMVGGDIPVLHAIRKLGVTPAQIGPILKLHRTQIHLLLARRIADPALAERLRKGMQALQAGGRIDALTERYTAG